MHYLFTLIILGCSMLVQAKGDFIDYQVNDNLYEGYYISAGDLAPLVLLVHDWDGLTDYEVKRAQMLVEQGYSVFAADLFGKGIRPTEVKDKKQHTGELYQDRQKMRALLNASLEKAYSLGAKPSKAIALGYCFGGAAILEMARSGAELSAFVSFHGGLSTPETQNYAATKGKVLVLHGTADSVVSMEDFADLAKRLEADKVKHEMISYGGAPHAFTVFGSDRYHEETDKKSWARFLDFIK